MVSDERRPSRRRDLLNLYHSLMHIHKIIERERGKSNTEDVFSILTKQQPIHAYMLHFYLQRKEQLWETCNTVLLYNISFLFSQSTPGLRNTVSEWLETKRKCPPLLPFLNWLPSWLCSLRCLIFHSSSHIHTRSHSIPSVVLSS